VVCRIISYHLPYEQPVLDRRGIGRIRKCSKVGYISLWVFGMIWGVLCEVLDKRRIDWMRGQHMMGVVARSCGDRSRIAWRLFSIEGASQSSLRYLSFYMYDPIYLFMP